MNFLLDYSLFLAKAATIVVSLLVVAGGMSVLISKAKNKEKLGKLTLHKMNEKYQNYESIVVEATQTKKEKKLAKKIKKSQEKLEAEQVRKRLFLIHFDGDIKASGVQSLREEITAVLLSKRADDEVLLCIESPGGLVHGYGLAAAQIQRLKDQKIKITIAVDKVAASGGYMMACIADHLIAAPFAVIGSIGVVAQLPNFHRWLDKKEIDFEQITAGQYKRTLTMFGKNTPEGREKFQEEIDEVHELLKSFIERYRPQVDIAKVATGEHWLATRALELNLLDEIQTSDDFLLMAKNHSDIYQVKYEIKKTLSQRMNTAVNMLINKFCRLEQTRY